MQHLVTGGSGYFGSLLVKQLLERGYQCRVFDLNDANDRPASVEFIRGDIRDYAAVRKACENVGIIHHNVAQVPLAKDRHLFHSVNVDGTEALLRAAKEAGVGKVVHTSSSAVFGVPRRNPVTEDDRPVPAEPYGHAKLLAERLCLRYSEDSLDVSIIRPRTILGHGRLGIFQLLFEWIRTGANVPVLDQGENVYQFIHADDLADACIRASRRPGPEIYDCGTDRFGTMREALEHLCAHAATGSRVVSMPMALTTWAMRLTSKLGLSPLGPYHSLMYGRSMYFDITKAQRELAWQPHYSNNEMFVESYEWYLRNRETVLTGQSGSAHRRAVREGILRLVRWVL